VSLFSHMRMYAVYVKPGAAHGEVRPVLIKESFNIIAFLFGFFWAIAFRLWWPLAFIIAFNIAVIGISQMHLLTQPSIAIIQLAFQVLVGLHAADWRQSKLRAQGYVLQDMVAAENLMRAEQRYFERVLAMA
jgi:hypothetical protein